MKLIKIEGGRINVYEPQILPVGAAAVVSGQALTLSAGKLVKAAGKPTFVALADGASGAEIPVGRVESNQVYEVALPIGGVTVGAKYTLSTDGTGITTNTSDGVAEVVYADSTVAHVRF